MNFTLAYPSLMLLGKSAQLAANKISPMWVIASEAQELEKNLDPKLLEELPEVLTQQGVLVKDGDSVKPAKEIMCLIKALYQPEKCINVKLMEKDAADDIYFVPLDGAWVQVIAKRGMVTVNGPFSYQTVEFCLNGYCSAVLASDAKVLCLQRSDENRKNSYTLTPGKDSFLLMESVFDINEGSEHLSTHKFDKKSDEEKSRITQIILGKCSSARDEAKKEPKPSLKRAAKGFIIALAVNVCASIIIGVIKAIL